MLSALLAIWLVIAVIPGAIAQSKGRSFLGFFIYGLLLLPVALIHALIMRRDERDMGARGMAAGQRKCPSCAELIKSEASVCRYCGRDVQPADAVGA